MKCEVRLFARARDLAGAGLLAVELPEGATVAELRQRLLLKCPALAGLLAHSAFGLNDEFAADSTLIPRGATVALLPPVSGG